jgi:eukaryotic-like serine/threonine-protein kinase
MNVERWQKVKEIFTEAVDLKTEDRAKFLNEAINGDDELRQAVEKLLASDEDAKTIYNNFSLIQPETVKDVIGNYKILKKIGEGGMGAVYLAERADVRQKVALKIIRHGADSDVILRRFRREQEILAALEHPNIARLLDVGVSADNVPFLAMEYVEGVDLTTYSNNKNLSVAGKLNLFRKVCEAVAYAHSRLIVHRDLKPSNIIVNEQGEPKLLDFGISKLISETESPEDKGTVTSLGMLTPNYASPEQFRGETVSTSTDVYSLGVILYELLTDTLPYQITNKRIDEVARAVCETNPPRPSEAVVSQQLSVISYQLSADGSTERNQHPTKENQSKTNPKSKIQNLKLLRGDLDNILLKALRKEPARRYSSVEQFSEDLRRHLQGLPVVARPDTFSYRAEKFIKRNRVSVASAALVFLLLIGGVVGISWQYIRAERQRQLAEQRFNQVREIANNVVFKYHDGIANLQGSTEIRKMLVNDATKYLDNLSQDGEGDAGLQRELANAYVKLADVQGKTYYSNIGDTNGAIENYRKAAGILETLAASTDETIKSQAVDDLIVAYQTLGMIQSRIFAHADSVATQGKALALVEAKAALAPDDVAVQYLLVRANGRYADSLREGGRFDEAIEIYRRTLAFDEELFRRAPDNENVEVAVAVLNDRIGRNLALRAIELKKIGASPELYTKLFDEAETRLDRMFGGFEKLIAAHPEKKKYRRDLSTAYSNLGMIYRETGQLEKSRQMLEEDLRKRETVAAKDLADRESQADLSEALWYLAQTKAAQKQFADAFTDFKRAIEIYDKLIAADSANMEFRGLRFEAENHFADALRQSGDAAKAVEIYQSAFEHLKKDAPGNPYFVFAEGVMNENVGDCYAQMSASQINLEKANAAYRKTSEMWETEQIRRSYLSRTPEKLESLNRKISDYDRNLAKLNL